MHAKFSVQAEFAAEPYYNNCLHPAYAYQTGGAWMDA